MDYKSGQRDADLKLFMRMCWNKYKISGDLTYLIEAVNAAPFFGERQLAKEIAQLLKSLKQQG
tara:strand:+ start:160 stop:348 length:189 start_codon:yes stop_codon:yes gene_type:complete